MLLQAAKAAGWTSALDAQVVAACIIVQHGNPAPKTAVDKFVTKAAYAKWKTSGWGDVFPGFDNPKFADTYAMVQGAVGVPRPPITPTQPPITPPVAPPKPATPPKPTGSNASFYARVLSHATRAAAATGIPTAVILAQWALESAYGTSSLAKRSNNLAGIGGAGNYRTYADVGAFADDYARLMNAKYPQVKGSDPVAVAKLLGQSPWAEHHYRGDASGVEGGFAGTAGTEGQALIKVMKRDNLASIPDDTTGDTGGSGIGQESGTGQDVINIAAVPPATGSSRAGNDVLLSDELGGLAANIAELITQTDVSLSISENTEVVFHVDDPGFTIAKQVNPQITSPVTWHELSLRVAALDYHSGVSGWGGFVMTCRSTLVQTAKHTLGPEVYPNTDVAAVLAQWFPNVAAQGTALPAFTQLEVLGATIEGGKAQSRWDAAQGWAAALGCWLFESQGTVWFGKPSWLVTKSSFLPVAWGGSGTDEILEIPSVRTTEDSGEVEAGQLLDELTLTVHARLGRKLRQGMRIDLTGVPRSGTFIVTTVEGSEGPGQRWIVRAQTPIDPVVTDSSADPTDPDAPDGAQSPYLGGRPIGSLPGRPGPGLPRPVGVTPVGSLPGRPGPGMPIPKKPTGVPALTQTAVDAVDARFPGHELQVWGDAAHMARASCHNTGKAIDIITASVAEHDAIVAWALANRTQYKITVIISRSRIWSGATGFKPDAYKGESPHNDHVHLSIGCNG